MSGQPFFWTAKDGWYLWERDSLGKRKRVFLAKTKKAAWTIWKDRLALSIVDDSDPPFHEVAARWLARQEIRFRRGEVAESWIKKVRRTISAFNAANPTVRCSRLTSETATAWLGDASAAYEHSEVSTLKRILTWAVRQKAISSSPLEDMQLSKGARREVVFTVDQHREFVRKGSAEIRCLLWFAWWTGCRPGELRELRWEFLAKDCSQAVLVKHKNARATGKHRVVFFPPNAQAILVRHRKKNGPVFTNSRGDCWTKDAVVGWARKLRKRSGMTGTAYAYRHSYATRALEQGVLAADLAEILGTSVEVISRNYSHLDKSQRRLADIAARVR